MLINNTDYMVRIVMSETTSSKTPAVIVHAPMPAEFMFDSTSTYQAPFAQGLFGNGALASLARVGGLALTSQALTAQIWQGSNETQLGVELEFQAESDPLTEVRDPILALLKLATPSMAPGSGMLLSPGPQLNLELAGQIASEAASQLKQTVIGAVSIFTDPSNSTTDGSSKPTTAIKNGGLGQGKAWKDKIRNVITIQIGNYAYFDSVVITDVQKTYTSQIDPISGWPMHARVSVKFKPLFLLLQDDLDDIFGPRKARSVASASNNLTLS